MPAANPWASIINPHRHTSAVADANARAKRQRAMRRRQFGAIQTFPIGCGMAAQPITSAVNARHFGARKIAHENQRRRYKGSFRAQQIAKKYDFI